MPSKCSAPRCTNSNKDGYCCVKFAQDPELRQKWIDAAGIQNWKPPKSAVLCEVSTEACVQMFCTIAPVNVNKQQHNINVIISHSTI